MARFTGPQVHNHRTAEGLLEKQILNSTERQFVLSNWLPGMDQVERAD